MGWNYLSIPKLQRCNRWSLGMDKLFHLTLYQTHYLTMLIKGGTGCKSFITAVLSKDKIFSSGLVVNVGLFVVIWPFFQRLLPCISKRHFYFHKPSFPFQIPLSTWKAVYPLSMYVLLQLNKIIDCRKVAIWCWLIFVIVFPNGNHTQVLQFKNLFLLVSHTGVKRCI